MLYTSGNIYTTLKGKLFCFPTAVFLCCVRVAILRGEFACRLCWEKFGWGASKADELLLPVLKEYNKHEVTTFPFSRSFFPHVNCSVV